MFKKAVIFTVSGLLLSTIPYAAEPKIEAYKAPFHVGKSVMACGNLAQTKHLSNRHYLNLDKKHPNQSLTILVWDNDYRWFEEKFGKIDSYVGRRFCVRGTIEDYKGNLQIKVSKPQFLRLMDN